MKTYFLILPVALLVAYSQVIVKIRATSIVINANSGILEKLFAYLFDPFIISAYSSALIASFAWLFVVTKLPLSIAFPIYIGLTFILVLFGSWLFLAETPSPAKLIAVILIFSGMVLGVWADA